MKNISKNSLMEDYIIKYLEREKNFVKESSYAVYSSYTFNKIIPYFEEVTLRQLNLDTIQAFCNHLFIF